MNGQTCNSLSESSQISTSWGINNEKDMMYNAVAFYIHIHISVDYLIGWHFAKGLGLSGLSRFLQCQFFSCWNPATRKRGQRACQERIAYQPEKLIHVGLVPLCATLHPDPSGLINGSSLGRHNLPNAWVLKSLTLNAPEIKAWLVSMAQFAPAVRCSQTSTTEKRESAKLSLFSSQGLHEIFARPLL